MVQCVPIRSFADGQLERFFADGLVPGRAGWREVATVAQRKLDMLDYAVRLVDLASPPGNRLEALEGALAGYYSIRVNQQWRIIFRWTPEGPEEVSIVD